MRGRTSQGWQVVGTQTSERLAQSDVITPMGVDVYSSDVETIATVLRLVGAGTIYYRPPRPNYRSPHGRQAFATKDNWHWSLRYKVPIIDLLRQVRPYLTSKRWLATLALPIAGGSCHPSHGQTGRDTRSVQRAHRWRFGHDPSDPDATPESGWKYVHLDVTTPTIPNQRYMLKGGPESGLPCPCEAHPHCHEMTRVAAEMSAKDIFNQPEVEVANRDLLTEKDWARLVQDIICALICPKCECVVQMKKQFLPRMRHPL